jgi:putative nucleotidyltransferase with HDIG domain
MKRKLVDYLKRHRMGAAALALVSFSFLLSLLMNLSWGELPSGIEIGKIARQDIRADKDYEILDEEATERLRKEALANLVPLFDWDEDLGSEKIIEDRETLAPWKEKGILVRRLKYPDQPPILIKDFGIILSLEEARAVAARRSRRPPPPEVRPTLFFNEAETKMLEEKALADVKPAIIKVQAGESIIRSGDHFEPRHATVINGIRKEKAKSFGRTRLVGTFFFVALFSAVFLYVLGKNARKGRIRPKDLAFMGLLLLTLVLMERSVLFVSGAIRALLPVEIPLASFYALVPIAAGTMMVRLVLPLPMALLFAPLSAALAGMILKGNLYYTLFYLVGNVLGIQLMANVRSRGKILRVGLELGLVNALTLLTLDMVSVTSIAGVMSLRDSGIRIALAFLGGTFSAVTVLILMPVFESLFNYLTPIKLLEFGSLNHPILREMIVRAPGTYHHSHMVGTLAEAACEAIGADSLFARVASYFHDIGKMKKSPYFIENQPAATGEDRHANLSPSMSALIISSHVKDGIELARQYKLPERIIDIIPQHQGTKLISYFYNKAKESEKPEIHVVNEQEYRYPGPRPQTKEAGVILLADTVEAATRALKDRSPARLEEVVRNMINKNFIDGQLDECELTLKDLHTIAKNFVRILMGIYHQRIEYPPEAHDHGEEIPFGEMNADKYSQPKPIREDSLKEAPASPPKSIPRIGPDRSRH